MPDGRVMSHLITEGTYLVSAGGELVGEPGTAIGHEIERLVDDGAREVVVDLGDVTFVDASAVAALLAAGKRARRARAVVTLVCDDENVRRVVEIVGVPRVLAIEYSVTSAFAGVAARASATVPSAAA
jgi:anti-sigma B factor antagonist